MAISQSPENHVRASLRHGLSAARAGDHAEARYWFQVGLETDPDNITALLWLAWLAPSRRESLSLLSRVLELDPKNEPARAAICWARRRHPSREPSRSSSPQEDAASGLDPLVADQPKEGSSPFRLGIPGRIALLRDGLQSSEPQEEARSGAAAQGARRLIGPLGLLLAAAACLFTIGVTLMAWYSPSAVSAWMLPTVTSTVTPLPVLAVDSLGTPTTIALSAATSTPPPNPTAIPTTLPPPPPTATSIPASASSPSASGGKWIDVDLTHQRLTAYQGNTPVFEALISTGLPNTPTVIGQFRIYWKLMATDMTGPGYHLPDVPYTMYFHGGYALHGTYWHNNFGQPMSHGCVNLRTEDAQWLFDWADPTLPTEARQVRSSDTKPGTLVIVHY